MKALEARAAEFGVALGGEMTARLRDYFELVAAWNPRLHLVAPCAPAEFATRHVLESLLALQFIPASAAVVDVGSGAGLPVVPCLVARPDVGAILFESSPKKAVFLREALGRLGLRGRGRVLAERFERASPPEADVLTCRALDRFTELFPALLKWSGSVGTLLLFGGPTLREEIERAGLNYTAVLAPGAGQRFLFVVERTPGRSAAPGPGPSGALSV